MHNFEVHSNESAYRKSGRLGLEQVTNEHMEIEMTEPSVETVNTEKEMSFDDLTITGDYSDYDVLEE